MPDTLPPSQGNLYCERARVASVESGTNEGLDYDLVAVTCPARPQQHRAVEIQDMTSEGMLDPANFPRIEIALGCVGCSFAKPIA